ncbi:MAG: hypothetical protein C0627_00905 [Sulfurimonas sp.]|jgi:antirestriction protein ArdC|nr:MAG: hypothetical protein C0627_00905 [Sulfurimonas sp.]
MQTQNNNTTEQRHYRKTVIELYTEAVDKVTSSKLSAQQVSASGNNFTGLNNNILANAQKELGYKSNIWFTEKQMQEQNLVQIDEDNYGVILFFTYLKDIEGTNRKEKALRFYKVFNKDALETIPL